MVTGGGHAAATAITAGVLSQGTALIELGGAGGLFAPTAEALRDPSGRLATTCHCLAGTWALSAGDLAGTEAMEWLQENVFASEVVHARRIGRDPLEPLTELAAEVPPGADGLIYLAPTAGGPRAGGFVGLGRRHGRGHLVRAVLESGAIAARAALAALADLKHAPDEILAAGPGSANTLWCQILADALDRPIHAVTTPESAATGAAILAGSAVGLYKTVQEACAKMVRSATTYQPRKAATEVYLALAPTVARLPGALAGALADPVAPSRRPRSQRMSLARGPLLALHTIFATLVVIALLLHLGEREREVAKVRAIATQEHAETVRSEQDITQQKALLDGLANKDPYVVELLVRDKLQFTGPGEITPPPLPAVDKAPARR